LEAERANIAKSRFLAAASHDLRQPLQSLTLLKTLLHQTVTGDRAKELLARFAQTLGAMSGMLDTLLDINQIEAGAVDPICRLFPSTTCLTGCAMNLPLWRRRAELACISPPVRRWCVPTRICWNR
jgi:two-component system CheB/CheR fusion protein